MSLIFKSDQLMNTERPINIDKDITIEALLSLEGNGDNPTIFCLPISEKWEPPNLSYRLGFEGKTRKLVFQFLLDRKNEPISITSPDAVSTKTALHVAGTYDGKIGRLYVNGKEVAQRKVKGKIKHSNQPAVIGGRSKTDQGGYLVAILYEIRLMKCIRTPEEIDFWKDKKVGDIKVWKFDTPKPPDKKDYLALWST